MQNNDLKRKRFHTENPRLTQDPYSMNYNNNGNVFNGGGPYGGEGPPTGRARGFSTRGPPPQSQGRPPYNQIPYGVPPPQFQQQQHYPPQGPPLKRQRFSEDAPAIDLTEEQKYAMGLKKLFVTIGDDLTTIDEDIRQLIANFVKDRDVEKHTQLLADALVACIEVFPQKAAVYANLLAEIDRCRLSIESQNELSAPHAAFIQRILNEACTRTNNAFATASIITAKIWLRFLAHCANCGLVDADEYLQHLVQLLETACADPADSQISPVYRENILYMIIILCAHIAPKHASNDNFENLTSLLAQHMQPASRNQASITLRRIISDETYTNDALEARYSQFKAFEESGWKSDMSDDSHLVYPLFKESADPIAYPLTALTLTPSTYHYHPLVYSRLGLFEHTGNDKHQFKPSEVPAGLTPSMLLFLEDYLNDLLYICRQDVKEFIARCVKLHTSQYEHVIADILFGSMLTVPHSPYNPLSYAAFTIGLMYESEQYTPLKRLITRYTDILFELVPKMSVSVQLAFVRWFSLHVANFENRWQWSIYDASINAATNQGDDMHSKKEFLRSTLSHLHRLTAQPLDVNSLPRTIIELLPPPPNPNYIYMNPQHPLHQIAHTLIRQIREIRAGDTDQILEFIRNDQNIAPSDRLTFFTHVYLVSFSRSIDDIARNVERCKPVFESLIEGVGDESTEFTEDGSKADTFPFTGTHTMVTAILEYWASRPFKAILTMQVFIQFKILKADDVIMWFFKTRRHPDRQQYTASVMDSWELLRNCLHYIMDRSLHHLERREYIRRAPLKAQTSYADQTIPSAEELDQRNKSEWPSAPIFFLRHFATEDERATELQHAETEYTESVAALRSAVHTLYTQITECVERAGKEDMDLVAPEMDFISCLLREYMRHRVDDDAFVLRSESEIAQDFVQVINEGIGFFARISRDQDLSEQTIGDAQVESILRDFMLAQ